MGLTVKQNGNVNSKTEWLTKEIPQKTFKKNFRADGEYLKT